MRKEPGQGTEKSNTEQFILFGNETKDVAEGADTV
jgi:hypothetical protein